MVLVRTAKGIDVEATMVVRGSQYPVLHIYTHTITPVQAYQIFGDPENTKELTVIEDVPASRVNQDGKTEYYMEQVTRVFHDFTEVYSVQKSPLGQGTSDILIWLQRPVEDYD